MEIRFENLLGQTERLEVVLAVVAESVRHLWPILVICPGCGYMSGSVHLAMSSCSSSLPLHEGLVVATGRPEELALRAEGDTDNVLGVAAVGAWHAAHESWVSEELDKTVIVSTSDELTIV